MAFTMTDTEYLQLLKDLFKQYEKQKNRYNKMAKAYLEKFKHETERCNRLLSDIEKLKNKIENTQMTS